MSANHSGQHSKSLQWSDIDKKRFFGIGTGMYSALTVMLHPITVLKTRQQILSTKSTRDALEHQTTLRHTFRDAVATRGLQGLFRGLGIVFTLAIPARVIYIGVLESARQDLNTFLSGLVQKSYSSSEVKAIMPLVWSVSGGLAGGLAAVSAQLIVVPMDVISQKQMVGEGTARGISQGIIETQGYRGLYKGFGLSIVNSIPSGTIWWATYSACQEWAQSHSSSQDWYMQLSHRGATQLFAGFTAALVASTFTQPLDVVKTRLQVGSKSAATGPKVTPWTVLRKLIHDSGVRGLFRGLGPRTMSMGLWGTILSSAYELLRHVSRKDHAMKAS